MRKFSISVVNALQPSTQDVMHYFKYNYSTMWSLSSTRYAAQFALKREEFGTVPKRGPLNLM
jgi:hypothetical protein